MPVHFLLRLFISFQDIREIWKDDSIQDHLQGRTKAKIPFLQLTVHVWQKIY